MDFQYLEAHRPAPEAPRNQDVAWLQAVNSDVRPELVASFYDIIRTIYSSPSDSGDSRVLAGVKPKKLS